MTCERWLAVLVAVAGCARGNLEAGPATSTDGPVAPPVLDVALAVDVSVWQRPLAESQMDCLWDTGVRHVVVGTQDPLVARQQLAMAVARGMTVDAYVELAWDVDIASQIQSAFAMVQDFPIGRMWLAVDEDPHGLDATTLEARIGDALNACEMTLAGRCGIETSASWWQTNVANTTMCADRPLWYVLHDQQRSLADWTNQAFGGWTSPVGKQFQTASLCGADGVQLDVLQATTMPSVTVDRSPPVDTGLPPVAPANLFPPDGEQIPIDYVKIMSDTVPRATTYQLALDQYNGTAWAPYYTWTDGGAYETVMPPATPALFRLRARAQSDHGWGAWSDYVSFDYGTYTGPRPGNPPPPPPDIPTSLAPDGGVTITTASVTTTCSTVTGATAYDFAIESYDGTAWAPYYTYTVTSPTHTFYPQYTGRDYRFRARALLAGTYHAWSYYATFHVQ